MIDYTFNVNEDDPSNLDFTFKNLSPEDFSRLMSPEAYDIIIAQMNEFLNGSEDDGAH